MLCGKTKKQKQSILNGSFKNYNTMILRILYTEHEF